jgi:hypothetical protein
MDGEGREERSGVVSSAAVVEEDGVYGGGGSVMGGLGFQVCLVMVKEG